MHADSPILPEAARRVTLRKPLSIWIAGSVDECTQAAATGLVDAIVTNPTVVADWCSAGRSVAAIVNHLAEHITLPLFIQTRETAEAATLFDEAVALAQLSPMVIPKLPATLAGLQATRRLAARGIRPLITTVCTVRQALAFAANGAGWLCPYYTRLKESGGDPDALIRTSAELIRKSGVDCAILPASIREPGQIDEAMAAGACGVIIFAKTFREMLTHPVTDRSLATFERDDWPRIGR